MPYAPVKIAVPSEPTPVQVSIFGGIDFVSRKPTRNNPTWRTPDAANFVLDEENTPDKRPGWKKVFSQLLGAGKVNGLFLYRRADGTKVKLVHHSTKLYVWHSEIIEDIIDGNTATDIIDAYGATNIIDAGDSKGIGLIYSGLADHKSINFLMNDKLYILDGTNYVQYDGDEVVDVTSIATIPILTRARKPDGSTSSNDSPINALTPFGIDAFNGDGTSSVYKLSAVEERETKIAANPIVGSTDGGVTWNKAETTDFTVNRTTGEITVNTPSQYPTGTSNIHFKYADDVDNSPRIKKCTYVDIWYSRVFFTGNSNYPNMDFMSEVEDPTYFPEDGWTKFGIDGNPIMTYDKQYGVQLIIKGDDNTEDTIYKREINTVNPEIAPFMVKSVKSKTGCIARYSAQMVGNNSTWLSKNGIKWLVATNVEDEKDIQHISDRIDKSMQFLSLGLLREPNLQNAISYDFKDQYILCVNNHAYVFDYKKNEWYFWTNTPAACFMEDDGYLYFGSNEKGRIYRFKLPEEFDCYVDEDEDVTAIDGYYKLIMTNFNASNMTKIIPRVNYSIKPASQASITFGYITEQDYVPEFQTDSMRLFDFGNIDFGDFTFETNYNSKPVTVLLALRDRVNFQAIFANKNAYEPMGFRDVLIEWDVQGYVR